MLIGCAKPFVSSASAALASQYISKVILALYLKMEGLIENVAIVGFG